MCLIYPYFLPGWSPIQIWLLHERMNTQKEAHIHHIRVSNTRGSDTGNSPHFRLSCFKGWVWWKWCRFFHSAQKRVNKKCFEHFYMALTQFQFFFMHLQLNANIFFLQENPRGQGHVQHAAGWRRGARARFAKYSNIQSCAKNSHPHTHPQAALTLPNPG